MSTAFEFISLWTAMHQVVGVTTARDDSAEAVERLMQMPLQLDRVDGLGHDGAIDLKQDNELKQRSGCRA